VIANGETIKQIVPRADELVVEAKVALNDIDQVAVGAEAVVRVLAGNQRTTPVITGRLTRVSADLTREQQQNSAQPTQAYPTVRIVLPAEEIARLRDIHLLPGMPVEVFVDPRGQPAAIPAQAAAGADRTNASRAMSTGDRAGRATRPQRRLSPSAISDRAGILPFLIIK
jgi:hypothetical protein